MTAQGCRHTWESAWLVQLISVKSEPPSIHQQFSLDCGIPQSSCLGPLLFIIYISMLLKVIEHHLPQAHCFAEDTQLYLSFRADDHNAQDELLRAMKGCIHDLKKWLIDGRLLLNDDKTEFLVIGTRHQLNKLLDCKVLLIIYMLKGAIVNL